ncbi:endothelin-converting enzyme 1-like [Oratosquilla oratoria]|uniref:endothelin-converting enzyme 1-like n=1 Tax=Oratosquilla oratoria TaxID=337810 RepID=UPI003F7734C8
MDEPEDVNSIEWKLKTFYSSCMNIRPYMNTGLILLKRKIISELHGWTLMRDTWDIRRWEFEVVLTKLHADYGTSPFFKVTVVPDPRREGHNIIKLLPSGFSMPHRSYYDRLPNNEVEQAYKQYIKDTVKLFEASGPDAIEFATHLFHYESRIAEITPTEAALNDPNSSNVVISVGELTQIARSVPWLDLLRNMFPNSKLDHRTDILVVSREYFIDLSTLISTTDRSLLNNYLIFSFVTAFMPYLSDNDKRVLDLYVKEFTGTHEPRERWEFCIESTNKFMGFGLGSLYERSPSRLKARRKNVEVITAMFNQIRNTLGSNLAYSRWYPIVTRAQLTAKLNNMSIAVGYPDSLIDPEIINKYFQEYTIFTKDFFKNLFDSILNSQKQLELKLINPMPEASWMDALNEDSITYVHEANKIVIPPHLLTPPLFHRNYPKAMLYGSMGVRIAREMLRSMGSVGLAWNSRGQIVERNLDMNRTLENLQAVSDCVSDATKKLAVEEDAVVDRTAPDTAAEVDAIRQTYQAYVNLMKYEQQPQHPSFEHLNTTNIFFMAYAGGLCLDATPEQEDIDRTCSSSLLNKPKLEAVLAQLPEFRQVFNCSPDSKHFAKRACAQLH